MRKKPWLYSAPALLLILIVVVFPIGYTAYISLTNMNLYHWADFRVIGLSNYVRALFKFDSGFLGALFTTLLWTVVNMALQLFCGFWIALGLNAKGLRLRRLYKTLLMLPWAMPAYVSILLWRVGIFNTEFGLLNQWLTALQYRVYDTTAPAKSQPGAGFVSVLRSDDDFDHRHKCPKAVFCRAEHYHRCTEQPLTFSGVTGILIIKGRVAIPIFGGVI